VANPARGVTSVHRCAVAAATILVAPETAGEAGTFATIRDPQGATLSFWQPDQHRGTWSDGTHGAVTPPVLLTPEPRLSAAFLAATLDWSASPSGAHGLVEPVRCRAWTTFEGGARWSTPPRPD
jgi:hypothetical protein